MKLVNAMDTISKMMKPNTAFVLSLMLAMSLSWIEALASNSFQKQVSSASLTSAKKTLGGASKSSSVLNASVDTSRSTYPPINGDHSRSSDLLDSSYANGNAHVNGNGNAEETKKFEPEIPCLYIAEANLPTDIGHFRLRAYRIDEHNEAAATREKNEFLGTEPCVIYCAESPPGFLSGSLTDGDGELMPEEAVPVRIHDQCFTSEVFGSQRCDCKQQLRMSLEYLQRNGGAIIYLQQEGRGIGLANKVAAYQLQDAGMDTVEANVHLGFPEDARQYGVVPSIMKEMGISSIQLMTNNPRKVERLRKLGVDIVGTLPMTVKKVNKHNRKYLETKMLRMNHKNFGNIIDLDEKPLGKGFMINGMPQMPPMPDSNVNTGDAAAAVAVASALMPDESDDEEFQRGAFASDNGYCFGPQSVEDAIEAIAAGEIVCVVDDMNRENEGDFIMAADMVTPEKMAEFVRYTSGVLCVAMEANRLDELKLPPMVSNNEDPKETAFAVTVDGTKKHGITTGISAADRAKTIKLLATPGTTADDFSRPGHIFPLRAKTGGVLERNGHTEASIDLPRLAGRHPSGVLCEIVSEENPTEMARLPELKTFCKRHGYVLTSIVDIAQYRRDTEDILE